MSLKILPFAVLTLAFVGLFAATPAVAQEQPDTPWPAKVADFTPPAPGEHPRLFFRESDLPELKAFAKTPAGQQMIARLKEQLGGDGKTDPASAYNNMTEAYGKTGPKPRSGEWPDGTYSVSHPAGYGFLYHLTGDKSYATLGIASFEKALEGQRDRDQQGRYSFRNPGGALRAGPSLGWYALGYDLLYDAMSPEQRKQYASAIETYDEGQWTSLDELARGARHNPGSNHWGMQVGGAGLALLAIKGDPELDKPDRIEKLLEDNRKAMIRNATEGFGDHGWYAEGDGTGVMASHIIYLPALQAYREIEGLDYTTPRPNARWPVLKFIHMSYPKGEKQPDFPKRGAYPHNVWAAEAMTGPGTFRSGFDTVDPEERPALLWLYNRTKGYVGDYETANPYPHNTILSFVNWPRDPEEANPGDVLPHAFRDEKNGFYATRNRWQDDNMSSSPSRPRPPAACTKPTRKSASSGSGAWARNRPWATSRAKSPTGKPPTTARCCSRWTTPHPSPWTTRVPRVLMPCSPSPARVPKPPPPRATSSSPRPCNSPARTSTCSCSTKPASLPKRLCRAMPS